MNPLWPHQERAIAAVFESFETYRRVCMTAPCGAGKCLARGTEVMMFSGLCKPVEKVNVGDMLMGPDSRPRRVLALGNGYGPLFRVTPRKGNSYVVNGEHILSLRVGDYGTKVAGQTLNVGIHEFLRAPKTFQQYARCWRTGVEFPSPGERYLDPYFLGLWLGDGDSVGPTITTADAEIMDYIYAYAKHTGARCVLDGIRGKARRLAIYGEKGKGNGSQIRRRLRVLGVLRNKHIPHEYLCGPRDARMSLLAGLIDSDGSLSHGGYDLVFVNKRLANNCVFLARSLGFAAYARDCKKTCVNNGVVGEYRRISISGDLSGVPVLLDRKRAPARIQNKDVLVSSIRVEHAGDGEWFGFELDGDGLFLLADFTVTHNSRIMAELICAWVDAGKKVALYTNRRLLIEQTSAVLESHGIAHGVRAADWSNDGAGLPVQICSLQTEESRVFKGKQWQLHDADYVLVDEAHQATAAVARKVMDCHLEEGARILGVTATPIDLGELYDTLIIAGLPSELRECGALVRVMHYAPDEPDMRKLKGVQEGKDLSEKQNDQAMRRPGLFGRVWDNFNRINPEHKPTILFAPSVAGSLWFAEQFTAKGVRAAHIDGEQVWVDGTAVRTSQRVRADLIEQSRDGRIAVICNRFVMREAVDLPWLSHCILATVFGSLQSYLQSGGRITRAFPGLDHVTVQDHGGNWHRHGSLGCDREWSLGDTNTLIAAKRGDRLRAKEDREPMQCPRCSLVLIAGSCKACGWEVPLGYRKSRPVVTVDGQLIDVTGDIFQPRRLYAEVNGPMLWERMYYRARSKTWNATFRQAMALFAQENQWGWPDPKWPFMPRAKADYYAIVGDVPPARLIPKERFDG